MSVIINLPSKQNNNLTGHIIYKNLFTPEECNKIINFEGELKKSPVQTSDTSFNDYIPDIRNSYSKYVTMTQETTWMFKRQVDALIEINSKRFNFVIDSLQETQILKYEPGGFFKTHIDLGSGILSTRKVSMILFLSNRKDYEGGNLVWNISNEISQYDQGTLILFPSYIPHTVEPITSGTRYTMVSWAHGPHFR